MVRPHIFLRGVLLFGLFFLLPQAFNSAKEQLCEENQNFTDSEGITCLTACFKLCEMGGEGQFITSKGASKRKPDTNQTNRNRKDHTSRGPTGGNQTTTRTLGRGKGHPRPRPTTTSHHN